jgi:hypothetical protein
MVGIIPADIGSAACNERMVRLVIKPGDFIADTPLGQILAREQQAVAAQLRADEIAEGEARLASIVESLLPHHLAREYEVPDEQQTAAIQEFTRWCRKEPAGYMPAKADTLAAYLIARTARGLSTDAAKKIVESVRLMHDISEKYIDGAAVKAVMAYLAELDTIEAATVVEAATNIELPKTNGGSHEQP